MARFSNPIPGFYDANGDPLDGGKMYFYTVGTTTAKDIYTDAGLSTANANPAILDAAGRLPDIYTNGSYRIKLYDKNDVLIFDRDNVAGDITTSAFANWVAEVTYSIGDIVTGSDDNYYVSLIDSNIGNDPTTSAASWTQIKFLRVWNTNETYALNANVLGSNGELYKSAVASNSGNDPTLDTDRSNWLPQTMTYINRAVTSLYAYANLG